MPLKCPTTATAQRWGNSASGPDRSSEGRSAAVTVMVRAAPSGGCVGDVHTFHRVQAIGGGRGCGMGNSGHRRVVNYRITPKTPAQQGLLLASHSNP